MLNACIYMCMCICICVHTEFFKQAGETKLPHNMIVLFYSRKFCICLCKSTTSRNLEPCRTCTVTATSGQPYLQCGICLTWKFCRRSSSQVAVRGMHVCYPLSGCAHLVVQGWNTRSRS